MSVAELPSNASDSWVAGVGAALGETPEGEAAPTGRASRSAVSLNHLPVVNRPGLPVGSAPATPPWTDHRHLVLIMLLHAFSDDSSLPAKLYEPIKSTTAGASSVSGPS